MEKESFYGPKDKLTNPYNLYMKHAIEKGNWDSIGMIFYVIAIICPIIFAFTISPFQALKIGYLPLSFLVPAFIFNMQGLPGKVFWLIQPALLLFPILVMQIFMPEPQWFALVPFIQCWLFWRMMRVLPNNQASDWRKFTARTKLSIEQCHKIIDLERQKPYAERGLALDLRVH